MILEKCETKRSNLHQPFSKLLKLKDMNPIFKGLLKFCTTKNLLVFMFVLKIKKKSTIHSFRLRNWESKYTSETNLLKF